MFDVLAFDDVALERTHEFIQWLFPLRERSQAVPDAPALSKEEAAAIRTSVMAQCALAAATDRMLGFYRTTHAWLAPSNHNHLRITRIIRSLRLLRGEDEADGFRDAIMTRAEEMRAPISALSRGYWLTA